MAVNWFKDIFTDQRILSATVCGAAIGAGVVYTLTKPEARRGGSSENSKWDKKPLRDYCIKHTNIIEPKPLVLLRQTTAKHERAIMESTYDVGQLLVLLMRMTNAKTVLEVGTFTGVALLTMAYELPKDGKAYALDVNDDYMNVGKPFMEMAGLRDQIEYITGPAVDSLTTLSGKGLNGTVDLIFIDADKGNYPNYLKACLELLAPGGCIVFDNSTFAARVILPEDQLKPNDREPCSRIDSVNKTAMTLQGVTSLLLDIGDGCLVIRKNM